MRKMILIMLMAVSTVCSMAKDIGDLQPDIGYQATAVVMQHGVVPDYSFTELVAAPAVSMVVCKVPVFDHPETNQSIPPPYCDPEYGLCSCTNIDEAVTKDLNSANITTRHVLCDFS